MKSCCRSSLGFPFRPSRSRQKRLKEPLPSTLSPRLRPSSPKPFQRCLVVDTVGDLCEWWVNGNIGLVSVQPCIPTYSTCTTGAHRVQPHPMQRYLVQGSILTSKCACLEPVWKQRRIPSTPKQPQHLLSHPHLSRHGDPLLQVRCSSSLDK